MRHGLLASGTMGLMLANVALVGCDSAGQEDSKIHEELSDRTASFNKHANESVRAAFPSARQHGLAGGVQRLYGASLASGASPGESAEQFRKNYAAAAGVADADLVPNTPQQAKAGVKNSQAIGLMPDSKTGQPKLWLYRYKQNKDGVPVYGAELRTIVRNDASNAVVWASSTVRALGDYSLPARATMAAPDPVKSLRAVPRVTDREGQPLPASTSIARMSEPKLIVFAGTPSKQATPRAAMEYMAETLPFGKWRFIADAATGDVIHVESLIAFDNVTGRVTGNRTQGAVAAECAGTVTTPLPDAELYVSPFEPNEQAFTDANGDYVLATAASGGTTRTVRSLMDGQFFHVTDALYDPQGNPYRLSQTVAPPATADFLHNPGGNDPALVQVNAYLMANEIRTWVLNYLPTFPEVADELHFEINVNMPAGSICPGNAWFDPWDMSINFCAAGIKGANSYANYAFGDVVHHEYGHRLVQAATPYAQAEYGEGMGDTLGALFYGQPEHGLGRLLNQCTVAGRNADNLCEFSPSPLCSSCGSEIHLCGQLLSGTIWDIREQLSATHPTTFADIINRLTVNSILLHQGDGISAALAIDFLTLDDDDGNLDNGTPHRTEICAGFDIHKMPCDPLPANTIPTVNAGPDQTITLPTMANLSGTASDDGLPSGTLITTWSLVSGPTGGTVVFGTPSALATTATFNVPGAYVIRLSAFDGDLTGQDELTVTVNPPARPCTDLCTNPIPFSIAQYRDFQAGNLGINEVCYETMSPIAGGNCGNFASPRTLSVNGVNVTCNYQNWLSVPPPRAGGYCIKATAGNYSYAYFAVWRGSL